MNFYIRVKTEEQLRAALDADVLQTGTYVIDYACFLAGVDPAPLAGGGRKVWLALPDVARQKDSEVLKELMSAVSAFDGVCVKSVDELGMLKAADYKGQVIGDAFMYAYNPEAIAFYEAIFPGTIYMLSDELTDDEALRLAKESGLGKDRFIYKLYGHQPVMLTAQCMNLNHGGRCGERCVRRFADDKGDAFLSVNECRLCLNTIYQAQPVSMTDKLDSLSWGNYLIDFTVEGAEEVRTVLGCAKERLAVPNSSRGHHFRGID